MSGADEHMSGAEQHMNRADEHTARAEQHMTDADKHTTGADQHIAGAEQHMSGADEHMSGADQHMTRAGRHMTSAGHVGDLVRLPVRTLASRTSRQERQAPGDYTSATVSVYNPSAELVGMPGSRTKADFTLEVEGLSYDQVDRMMQDEYNSLTEAQRAELAEADRPAAERRAQRNAPAGPGMLGITEWDGEFPTYLRASTGLDGLFTYLPISVGLSGGESRTDTDTTTTDVTRVAGGVTRKIHEVTEQNVLTLQTTRAANTLLRKIHDATKHTITVKGGVRASPAANYEHGPVKPRFEVPVIQIAYNDGTTVAIVV